MEALRDFRTKIDNRARNLKDRAGTGAFIKKVPEKVLTSNRPYPYIMGGEIENIENLDEKMPTKDNEPLARTVFKPFTIKYLASMPF